MKATFPTKLTTRFLAVLLSVCLLSAFAACDKPVDKPSPSPGPAGQTEGEGGEKGKASDPVVLPEDPSGGLKDDSFSNPEVDPILGPGVGDNAPEPPAIPDTTTGTPAATVERISPVYAVETVPLPPVGDLEPQIDAYIKKLETNVEELDGTDDYARDADTVVRDATALKLIALALGKHKDENKFQKAAPEIMSASQELLDAKSLADAKKAIANLKASTSKTGDPSKLKWEDKHAKMLPAMKAVPNINSTLNRYIRTEAILKKSVDKAAEGTAAIAVIGEGSIPNVAETIKPELEKEWKKECEKFRDFMLECNKLLHDFQDGKAEFKTIKDHLDKREDACQSCHNIFTEGVSI